MVVEVFLKAVIIAIGAILIIEVFLHGFFLLDQLLVKVSTIIEGKVSGYPNKKNQEVRVTWSYLVIEHFVKPRIFFVVYLEGNFFVFKKDKVLEAIKIRYSSINKLNIANARDEEVTVYVLVENGVERLFVIILTLVVILNALFSLVALSREVDI